MYLKLKCQTYHILERLLDLDYYKLKRSYVNSYYKKFYADFFRNILTQIIDVIAYELKSISMDINILNPFTNIVVYIIETIPIDELVSLNFVNTLLGVFISNCRNQTACAKV